MILCVPLMAQVGRYELHEFRPSLSDRDCLFLLDTQTGSIYELIYRDAFYSTDSTYYTRHFSIGVVLDGNEIYVTHLPDSLTIDVPTLSQVEAIEELWRRYKANPVILNDEGVAEVEELRKRWGLVEPEKP